MKPRIIVSVLDSLSGPTDVALTRALWLAHQYDSELHAVHVDVPDRVGRRDGEAINAGLVERIRRIAERSAVAGVTVVAAMLSGSPVRAIADYTDRVSADLVVVAKRARRASGYWSAGSFASALGKAVKSPTIAVAGGNAPPGDSGLFRNILVPIDFSAVSIRALSAALVLAQQSGGRLQLLHVLEGFPYETVYSGSRAFRLIPELHAQMAWRNRELRSLIAPDAWNWSEIDV